MTTEAVRFTSADGLSLEGEIDAPEGARGAVVVCHPHPKMGGTMRAPLLLTLRDRLVQERWAVVRFNFRGIGASDGEPSTGEEETADARGALVFTRRRVPGLPQVLAGWSFGAAVALTVAAEEDVGACVAIAPAIKPRPGVTAGVPQELTTAKPVLVLCGANDEQVAPEVCREWASSVPSARYVEVKAANHFFWGRYDVLADIVAGFLDEIA